MVIYRQEKREPSATLEMRRGLKQKCFPQLLVGRVRHRSAIGQFFHILSNSPRSLYESNLGPEYPPPSLQKNCLQ